MNTCALDASLLDLFLDGALSPEETETVQAHLDTCPECRSYIDDVLAMREFFPDVEDVKLPENFMANVMAEVAKAPQSRPRKQPWGKLAVAAACLAFVVVLQRFGLPMGTGGMKSAASIAPAVCASDMVQPEERMEAPCDSPAESPAPMFGITADSSSLESTKTNGAKEDFMSEALDDAILLTATEAELGDLLVDEIPSDIYPSYTCYLLNSDNPIVAALVERGFLQEIPGQSCTIRLEIWSE